LKFCRAQEGDIEDMRITSPVEFQVAERLKEKNNPFIMKTYMVFEVPAIQGSWETRDGLKLKGQYGYAIMMELKKGNLENYVLDISDPTPSSGRPLCEDNWLDTCYRFFAEMTDAVFVLHSLSVVHRDLKPENMLLWEGTDGKLHICLSDFGTARQFSILDPPRTAWRGTPMYAAPEVHGLGKEYNEKCDVHSLGVTFNVLLRREKKRFQTPLTFNGEGGEWHLNPTKATRKDFPEEARDLVTRMFKQDADERLSITEVWHHRFFEKVDKNRLKSDAMPQDPESLGVVLEDDENTEGMQGEAETTNEHGLEATPCKPQDAEAIIKGVLDPVGLQEDTDEPEAISGDPEQASTSS